MNYKLSGSGSVVPIKIMDTGYGHCGNYSILFAATVNHYLNQNKLSNDYQMNVVYVKDRWFKYFTVFNSHVTCMLINKHNPSDRKHIDPTFYDVNKIRLTKMKFTQKGEKLISILDMFR